jgi:glycosyltransferase involved in cell wall biosynthesis
LVRADLLHATSEGEYREFRELELTAPVAIVPNGIDVPDAAVARLPARERKLLFLGRIHPTKGMETLLSSWASLQATHADWSLVVAGVGDPRYEAQIKRNAVDLRLERVTFVGPLYGAAKSQAYFEAELFVLPSHSENFGMAVAEALAHGCPAVVCQGAPWAGLEREGCGWWVQNSVDALRHALDSAMQLPPDRLAAMGHHGRRWMARDFSWPSIAEQVESAYQWLVQGSQRPSCVRVD